MDAAARTERVGGRASAAADGALVERCRRLAIGLYQTIKVAAIHDFENRALDEPIGLLLGSLDLLLRHEGSATVAVNEGHLFVNGRRLPLAGGGLLSMAGLVEILRRKGLGGVRFERRLDRPAVKVLLAALQAIPAGVADAPGYLRTWLAEHGGEDLGVAGLKPRAQTTGGGVAVSLEGRARLLYAKLLVLLREILGPAAEAAAGDAFLMGRLKRAIQEIVSTSEQAPDLYLGLVGVKGCADLLIGHAANTAVLSVLVGRRLGLDRREAAELALAAAVHDLGKLAIPAEILNKRGELTPAERAVVARHPIEGALETIRRARSLDRSTMQRLVAIFEHASASSGFPERRPVSTLHLFSRVISVVDAYDALTTARPYRRAFLPDEALGELRREVGTRFDGAVVRALAALLGVYPQGTLVVLSSGERAVVLHNDFSDVGRPRTMVKVVVEADGRPSRRIVDLGEASPEGAPTATIVGTDDPAKYSMGT